MLLHILLPHPGQGLSAITRLSRNAVSSVYSRRGSIARVGPASSKQPASLLFSKGRNFIAFFSSRTLPASRIEMASRVPPDLTVRGKGSSPAARKAPSAGGSEATVRMSLKDMVNRFRTQPARPREERKRERPHQWWKERSAVSAAASPSADPKNHWGGGGAKGRQSALDASSSFRWERKGKKGGKGGKFVSPRGSLGRSRRSLRVSQSLGSTLRSLGASQRSGKGGGDVSRSLVLSKSGRKAEKPSDVSAIKRRIAELRKQINIAKAMPAGMPSPIAPRLSGGDPRTRLPASPAAYTPSPRVRPGNAPRSSAGAKPAFEGTTEFEVVTEGRTPRVAPGSAPAGPTAATKKLSSESNSKPATSQRALAGPESAPVLDEEQSTNGEDEVYTPSGDAQPPAGPSSEPVESVEEELAAEEGEDEDEYSEIEPAGEGSSEAEGKGRGRDGPSLSLTDLQNTDATGVASLGGTEAASLAETSDDDMKTAGLTAVEKLKQFVDSLHKDRRSGGTTGRGSPTRVSSSASPKLPAGMSLDSLQASRDDGDTSAAGPAATDEKAASARNILDDSALQVSARDDAPLEPDETSRYERMMEAAREKQQTLEQELESLNASLEPADDDRPEGSPPASPAPTPSKPRAAPGEGQPAGAGRQGAVTAPPRASAAPARDASEAEKSASAAVAASASSLGISELSSLESLPPELLSAVGSGGDDGGDGNGSDAKHDADPPAKSPLVVEQPEAAAVSPPPKRQSTQEVASDVLKELMKRVAVGKALNEASDDALDDANRDASEDDAGQKAANEAPGDGAEAGKDNPATDDKKELAEEGNDTPAEESKGAPAVDSKKEPAKESKQDSSEDAKRDGVSETDAKDQYQPPVISKTPQVSGKEPQPPADAASEPEPDADNAEAGRANLESERKGSEGLGDAAGQESMAAASGVGQQPASLDHPSEVAEEAMPAAEEFSKTPAQEPSQESSKAVPAPQDAGLAQGDDADSLGVDLAVNSEAQEEGSALLVDEVSDDRKQSPLAAVTPDPDDAQPKQGRVSPAAAAAPSSPNDDIEASLRAREALAAQERRDREALLEQRMARARAEREAREARIRESMLRERREIEARAAQLRAEREAAMRARARADAEAAAAVAAAAKRLAAPETETESETVGQAPAKQTPVDDLGPAQGDEEGVASPAGPGGVDEKAPATPEKSVEDNSDAGSPLSSALSSPLLSERSASTESSPVGHTNVGAASLTRMGLARLTIGRDLDETMARLQGANRQKKESFADGSDATLEQGAAPPAKDMNESQAPANAAGQPAEPVRDAAAPLPAVDAGPSPLRASRRSPAVPDHVAAARPKPGTPLFRATVQEPRDATRQLRQQYAQQLPISELGRAPESGGTPERSGEQDVFGPRVAGPRRHAPQPRHPPQGAGAWSRRYPLPPTPPSAASRAPSERKESEGAPFGWEDYARAETERNTPQQTPRNANGYTRTHWHERNPDDYKAPRLPARGPWPEQYWSSPAHTRRSPLQRSPAEKVVARVFTTMTVLHETLQQSAERRMLSEEALRRQVSFRAESPRGDSTLPLVYSERVVAPGGRSWLRQ